MNRRTFVQGVVATLALSEAAKAGPTSAVVPTGKVIFALGMIPTAHYHRAYLNLRMKSGEDHDYFSYRHDDVPFMTSDRDFDDESENGIVKIMSLTAGEWGIVSYSADAGITEYFPNEEFFIPFTVYASQTVYVGDYELITRVGKNWLGMKLEYDPRFIVTDKSQRDVAIAKRKDPSIGDVIVAVPDIAPNNPYFIRNKPNGGVDL